MALIISPDAFSDRVIGLAPLTERTIKYPRRGMLRLDRTKRIWLSVGCRCERKQARACSLLL